MDSDPHGLQILAISVAALLLGPGIHRVARRERVTMAALDNFVLVAVAGLVMVEILPRALDLAGWPAFLALVAGILGPSIAEGPLRLAARGTHGTALTVAVLGMAAHSFTDGLALASAHASGDSGHALEVAVIAHQLPVAVAVWWLLSPLGLARASAAMALLGVATVAGFVLADASLSALQPAWLGLFHALVGGLLLHVVAHRNHPHEHDQNLNDFSDGDLPRGHSHGHHAHTSHAHEPHHAHEHHAHTSHAHEPHHAHEHHAHTSRAPLASDSHEHHAHTSRAPHAHAPHSHGHHAHEPHAHAPDPPRVRVAASLGGLAGLGLLALLARSSSHGHAHEEHDPLAQVLAALLELTRDSAPALLLAFVLAGLVATFLPEAPLRWLRRGTPLAQAARGVAFGLPLPLCSCGVVPVYRGLLQRGVPAAAAMAFLVATPELGIDAVLLSLPLLGGPMTAARVLGAVAVALVVGRVVGGLADRLRPAPDLSEKPADPRPLATRLRDGVLRVGLVEMVDATAPWIVFGLLLAATIQPWLDPATFTAIPPALQVVLFAVLGVPTYVCASGATPLVAVLLAKGLSPGAALAFLLTGPATNATTYGLLHGLHGRRVALAFTGLMIALAVGLGVALDLLLPGMTAAAEAGHVHHEPGLFADLCLAALAALFLVSFLRQTPQKFVQRLWERDDHAPARPAEPGAPAPHACCKHEH
ncbi:MAG: permease [Myxococcales bacterium]|nr:permease [Myxococcales bacterium]